MQRGMAAACGIPGFGCNGRQMRVLFTFENPLPARAADAEVFTNTARCVGARLTGPALHVPADGARGEAAAHQSAHMAIIRAWAPLRPAALRHFCSGLTIVFRHAFRKADVVYTRNLWVAWMSLSFGAKVVFDHYRPWPAQIPPLQPLLYRLFCHRRFLANLCHSEYTRQKYIELGIPAEKLFTVHNGFDPSRFAAPVEVGAAKAALGIPVSQKTAVYTGRINHKKGLGLVLQAAAALPDILFILVGSYGEGPIEKQAQALPNIRMVEWQTAETLGRYVFAADVLLIPPSLEPLAAFGSTVLPLKLFFYLGSGRPILAGSTPDVAEVLQHDRNAWLCPPDDLSALIAGLRRLTGDAALADRLAAAAQTNSQSLTWDSRGEKITAIITARFQTTQTERGTWGRRQFDRWAQESWRWAVHIIRKRSLFLPPKSPAQGR
jgi:glycosyltransferase involved in cell wall biosynthesis